MQAVGGSPSSTSGSLTQPRTGVDSFHPRQSQEQPGKAFRSWLMPFMTPVLWRRRPSASRVGFEACETPRGLNPQAHTAKPDAGRAKYALPIVSQLTYIGATRRSDDTTSPKQTEWSFYENYFDWRKRKDRRTGSKGIGGCWPGDSQGRAQIWRFSSRYREPRKCQEALSSCRLV